ncbi:HNH endonuclease family protein [Myceligenerans cantabricum]
MTQPRPATTSPTNPRTLSGARLRVALGAALAALLAVATVAVPEDAQAYPPDIPSKEQVQSELDGLTVQPESDGDSYDRDLFPHWSNQGDSCNTREVVLQRDGEGVEVGSDCYPTSGSWTSQYDGVTTTDPSEFDIDHMVPLAEAWASGASAWTTGERESFANDLTGPQLIAVSASSNRSKSDGDPAEWVPPLAAKRCAYAKMWIHTKSRWNLTIDSAEKAAVQGYLSTCSY